MPQDGVDITMLTLEIMPVWKHVDDVLIAKLSVRLVMSTKMPSKGGGDERWVSKPNISEVYDATKIICRVWQVVSKIDRKGLCSLHRPNGGFKVTHGCSTPTLQLSSLVLCLCLREAPLLEICRMVCLYLILVGNLVTRE